MSGVLGDEVVVLCLSNEDKDCLERALMWVKRREEELLIKLMEGCVVCRNELLLGERGREEREETGSSCKGNDVVILRGRLEETRHLLVDTERAEELGGQGKECPIWLVSEVALKGGLLRLTLSTEVVPGALRVPSDLVFVTNVEDGVSNLVDFTGDNMEVNIACFTMCFGEAVVEDGAKE